MRVAAATLSLAGALAACAPTAPGDGSFDPALGARIDAVFAEYRGGEGPGCSVGVIRDGNLVFAAGYGAANLDHGIANGPKTVFRIGSVSKQVTAGAIALLATRGELDLDAPVQRYVPEFPDYPNPPTIRHLVHHISGVRDYLVLMSLAGRRDADFYTNQEVLDAINRQRELNFTPGSDYLYSNAGYFLLGEIVARASGRSLREFAHENFFAPLGMSNTHFHDDHNEIVPNRATGHAPDGDGFRIDVTTLDMVGDGGVFTTIEDWARWDDNLGRGAVGGPEWVALMHTRGVLDSGEVGSGEAGSSDLGSSDTIPYAFGLVHGEHRGLATVSHSGGFVGYRAGMSRYPDTGHSFAAFCNGAHIDPMTLLAATAEVVLGDEMTHPEPAARTVDGATADEREEGDAAQRDAVLAVADPARFLGSWHSPELDATWRLVPAAATGIALLRGPVQPLPLVETSCPDPANPSPIPDSTGPAFPCAAVLAAIPGRGNLTLRFAIPAEGRFRSLRVDAGRVRNLRFERVER